MECELFEQDRFKRAQVRPYQDQTSVTNGDKVMRVGDDADLCCVAHVCETIMLWKTHRSQHIAALWSVAPCLAARAIS